MISLLYLLGGNVNKIGLIRAFSTVKLNCIGHDRHHWKRAKKPLIFVGTRLGRNPSSIDGNKSSVCRKQSVRVDVY